MIWNKKYSSILIFIVFIGCLFLHDLYRKKEILKMNQVVIGKIYNYGTTGSLGKYYEYKYFYKGKFYKESEGIDDVDFSLIGRCFEVLLNPEDPSSSRLNVEKEVPCDSFYPKGHYKYKEEVELDTIQ